MTELEERIDKIRHSLVNMASLVEDNINNSLKCLIDRNQSLSDEISPPKNAVPVSCASSVPPV